MVCAGDAGPGYGLYRWPGGDAPPRCCCRDSVPLPSGEPVADFYSAAVDAAGNVYATVRGVRHRWMLVRLNNLPAVLRVERYGRRFHSANLGLYSTLLPGDRTGPVHLMAGGSQQSIFQANDQGLLPAILVGDRPPRGQPSYTGNNCRP